MHHSVCVIICTNGRRNDREGVRWLTGRRTCGLQSDQGSSRGALPGGRQRAFRYPDAASSAVTSNALTICSFWITLKDGVHVAEIHSRYRSTVHPCTCLEISPQNIYLWGQLVVHTFYHTPCLKQLSRLIDIDWLFRRCDAWICLFVFVFVFVTPCARATTMRVQQLYHRSHCVAGHKCRQS